jgi:hypothetical protein
MKAVQSLATEMEFRRVRGRRAGVEVFTEEKALQRVLKPER